MKKSYYIFIIIFVSLLFFLFLLPNKLFNKPTSTVLLARNGELLCAVIADDEQWRFPYTEKIPDKFKKAIITFEDKYFYFHPGINPISIGRALYSNIVNNRIVSGGSTISMQVIRLSRGGQKRTILEKIIESILTLRMELTYSKDKILALYAANVPMGSNVVGLEAAAWRYFGRSASQLSWAESATLAVLPNSPSLIFPGKNESRLLDKRNRLLDKLEAREYIDANTCELSKAEPLPQKPFPLPRITPQLMNKIIADGHKGEIITSTVDYNIQNKVNEIVTKHNQSLKANEINNIAAIVLEVNSGNILAYTGNVPKNDSVVDGEDVDIINSRRSPGSLLKPILFASMLEEGLILPNSLVADIPTQIGSYAPVNFSRNYDGAVPAKSALSRSLNVPAVRMLMQYGADKFNHILKKAGITTLDKPPSYYGLSIILGGSEVTLWDIAGMYASMARNLNYYNINQGKYLQEAYFQPHYTAKKEKKIKTSEKSYLFSAGTLWCLFNALVEVSRPEEDSRWRMFSSSNKIAWKTGTSFGFRDAWAIGTTPEYVVGVWTGNANGEGRPGLIGVYTAAPVMLDIFKVLNPQKWFTRPDSDLERIKTCRYSGYRATDICQNTIWRLVPKNSLKIKSCPYHLLVHLDKEEKFQLNASCASINEIVTKPWFVLPPVQESYFKQKNSFYKMLPPFRSDCQGSQTEKIMGFIYPEPNSKIYIPKELDGQKGKMVIKVVHRNPDAVLYWHLNNQYIGSTTKFHHMAIAPDYGNYTISVVDNNGEKISRKFEVLKPKI